MIKHIHTYTLPRELTILFIIVPMVLLLFATVFYFKQSYLTSVIFLMASIVFAISSTYRKSIFFDNHLKTLSIDKLYLGKTVSTDVIVISGDSELKLFREKHKGKNTMGYAEISYFLTLSIMGKNSEGIIVEKELCSEHRDDKKQLFLGKVKNISELIGVELVEL